MLEPPEDGLVAGAPGAVAAGWSGIAAVEGPLETFGSGISPNRAISLLARPPPANGARPRFAGYGAAW